MANILLTTDCQRACKYCFALGDRKKHMKFSWDNFIKVSNFMSKTKLKLINLLGGEPTLHEDFSKMLEHLIVNDFIIQVFTNGLASEDCINNIDEVLKRSALRKNQLRFAVNINSECDRKPGEFEQQLNFLNKFYKLSFLTFTIYNKSLDLSFLPKIIYDNYLDRAIRLGLAMPIIGVDNEYLPIDQYKDVAKNIMELANNSDGITISFDCGFPLCMFDLSDIQTLSKNEENDFIFTCGQPLDIYPDLTVTNCYPLSNVCKVNLEDYDNVMGLYEEFNKGFMTPTGIYGNKCADCQFFMKVCSGGCKGFYKPN